MRGVILEGQLANETVRVFLELGDRGELLYARRGYGERSAVLTLLLDEVEAALAALKAEQARQPQPVEGQLALADDDADGEA